MDYKEALNTVIIPGLALLPTKMDTPEARVMLLAIGMQESRFEHRKQMGGPAHGFYQFEHGGGIRGVLNHRWTKPLITGIIAVRGIKPEECYDCIAHDDAIATVFARLLLYTHPQPLPSLTSDPGESWQYYADTWRPGRPHRETFDAFLMHAREAVEQV